MSGFQIPGLTTLSQPQAASTPTVPESRQDEKVDAKSADSMVVDEPEVIQNSDSTTAVSAPATTDNGVEDSTQSMVIDKPDTTASDITPSATSNGPNDKEMEVVSNTTVTSQPHVSEQSEAGPSNAPPSPPSLISGLEALLGGLDPTPEQLANQTAQPEVAAQAGDVAEPAAENGEQGNPEWEEDSSPLESSSEDSSSSDSDDDSDDDKDYPVLGPEETARLLMEMEGGSDDDGEGRAKSGAGGAQVRTKNELPEEVIPVPDVKIEDGTELVELGTVEHIVETTIVVKANTTGEYRVLDSGSVLCTEGRTVIAAIADLIGSVRQPRYTARFTSREQMAEDFGLELGTRIFYAPNHATYVFTQALQAVKGTDASNWHDEEAGDDEVEFSDDEKEAEHKRRLKAKRKGGRGGKDGGAGGRGGRGGGDGGVKQEPNSQQQQQQHPVGLKYDDDDDDDDGPYKPLARPPGFGQGPPASQSVETGYNTNGYSTNRGRGRGGRGGNRGRGNRGGPRGGGGGGGGYSLPPRPQHQHQPQHQTFTPPAPPPLQQQSAFTPMQQPEFNYPIMSPTAQFPLPPWPPNPNMVPPPPPPQFANQQQGQQQQQQQQAAAAAAAVAGMYFNPAFYNAGGKWPGQPGG